MRKKNKVRGFTQPDIKLYYKVKVSQQHGIDTRAGIQIDGTESRTQK